MENGTREMMRRLEMVSDRRDGAEGSEDGSA
jgi:hypothetical protein